MLTNDDARPGDADQDGRQTGWRADPSVPDPAAIERARRIRRRASRDLDALFLHVPPSTITTADVLSLTVAPAHLAAASCAGLHDGEHDYWGACTGMNLGFPERVAAGRRLRERGWVA